MCWGLVMPLSFNYSKNNISNETIYISSPCTPIGGDNASACAADDCAW